MRNLSRAFMKWPETISRDSGLAKLYWALVFASVIIFLIMAKIYYTSKEGPYPPVFSPTLALDMLWNSYKKDYLLDNGRTVDPGRNNLTTSEAQSYTLLRAVWIGDQTTFDSAWQWTKNNLQRKNDHLFSWAYGRLPDGPEGILTDVSGQNSASDADSDIALSLIFAYSRWGNKQYFDEARLIANDIWTQEVVSISGRPYLVANNVEKTQTGETFLANPSYFSPYAYRIFSRIDPNHDWQSLVDSSYAVLEAGTDGKLDKSKSAHLPPDWIAIDRNTAEISAANVSSLSTNFGFDAMRVPWRLGLDWMWYHDPRAEKLLQKFSFLKTEWRDTGALYATYSHDGNRLADFQAPAIYGGSMGYFMTTDPQDATSVYATKLATLYDPDTFAWKYPLSYYDDNWSWFGLAMRYDLLPNLSADLSPNLPQASSSSTSAGGKEVLDFSSAYVLR